MENKYKPTIYFVRHGHTEFNSKTGDSLDGKLRGYLDVPLDELGRKQAKEVAAKFRKLEADEIFTSDLSRALDTAREIGSVTGAPVRKVPALRPWHLGEMAGKAVRDCIEEMRRLQRDMDTPAPGGDSFRKTYERFQKAVKWLQERAKRGPIVAVTHSRYLLSLPCILSDGDPRTIPQSGGALTGQVVEVQLEGNNWAIKTLADEAEEEKGEGAPKKDYSGHKGGKTMDIAKMAENLGKTAGVLCAEDHPNTDSELQLIVGDPTDVRTSTFAQFNPNPGTMQLPNPLSPVEGDEVFFAYMLPGAVFQANDGSEWNILYYGSPDEIQIENRWYPRISPIVSIGDVRRSIHQWIEPVTQTVPPPPPGVDYSALPVKVMDDKDNIGNIDELTDARVSEGSGW